MDIEELCRHEFERVVVLRDAPSGLHAFVVVHDTSLGPAFGGIRRWRYETADDGLADALRLAAAMTLKCAISDVPGGGGKTVVLDGPELDAERAYAAIGRCVRQLGGIYYTGPDVGTTADDLLVVARETEFVARPDSGCGELTEPTALGVFAGIRAVARRLGQELSETRIAVQGVGGVGGRLADLLAAEGAKLVVADVREDVARLAADRTDAALVAPDEILDVECDVLAPCALGGVVDERSIDALRARAIAGSANNVLADPSLGERLFDRGVVYAPDFVISSGALIHGALFHLEGEVPAQQRVLAIGERLDSIFAESSAEGVPPETVALRRAERRLQEARSSH